MKYISPIDPHVHARWTENPDNHLKLIHEQAKAVGLCAIMEMPNTTPTLTTIDSIHKRLEMVTNLQSRVRHYIHIGMTTDLNQVRSALQVIQERAFKQVVADKIFYTNSTGNTGLLDPDLQNEIWKIKGEMGYTGVSIGHFEDEKLFVGEFDPNLPSSHSYRQPEWAETAQLERQLQSAYDNNFQGTFYVAHCSAPESILLLDEAKKNMPFRIVVEGTFHHLLLNAEDDYRLHRNFVKCNPPIRHRSSQKRLLKMLELGSYDIIGTDHAPHPIEKKKSDNPPSGVPAIPFWPKGIEILTELVGAKRTEDLTYRTANNVFRLGLPRVEVEREYNPELWDAYAHNPFSRIDGTK